MAHWKLKIEEQFADEIVSGMKTFEVRKEDDKIFQKGDSVEFFVNSVKLIGGGLPDAYLTLTEDHPISGRIYDITYVLHGWGLREGYCAFAIKERVNEDRVVQKEDIVLLPPEIEIKEFSDTLKRSIAKDIHKMCADRPNCAGCIFNKSSEDSVFVCMLRDIPQDWRI